MGIYAGELTVPNAPVLLPKLCIAVKIITDVTDLFERLEVKIVKGEDEIELLSTGPVPVPCDRPNTEPDATRFSAQMAFMLAPFHIEEETILRVKAITEREEMRGMALRIRVAKPAA